MPSTEKIFSVVIPSYNSADFIRAAVDSVYQQILERIEIIIVDDASSDERTINALNDIERRYTEIRMIRLKKNSGVSVARNTGIAAATGKYALCLDADDTIEPTYLEKAKDLLDADYRIGIVSCGVQTFGAQNTRYTPQDKISLKDALVNSPVHTASCFRKADWEAGAIYDAELRGYEDWDHWLRIMKLGRTVRVIPEYLFNYYVRPGSKVETSNKNAFSLTSRIIENHRELYEKYFAYVIAKKHEKLVQSVNVGRKNGAQKRRRLTVCGLRIQSLSDVPRIMIKAKKKIFPQRWV